MEKGIVKFFDHSKGFGFIINAQTQEEIFVHSSGLASDIKQNDFVSYELKQGKKGLQAFRVRVV